MDSFKPGLANVFAQCLQGYRSETEDRIIRPDGSLRWIQARSFPIRDAEGKLIRIVGIAEDDTIRRERENVLRETHEKLNAALEGSREQTRDGAKLAELVDILQ